VTRTSRAIWWAAGFGAFFCFCLATLVTFPEYEKSAMRIAHEPAWWQFQGFAAIGMLLLAAPSYVIFLFNDFFAAHEPLRDPIAIGLAALEIGGLCFLVYRFVRSAGAASEPQSPGSRPNKSLERTREG
jgi:hypothetical protein